MHAEQDEMSAYGYRCKVCALQRLERHNIRQPVFHSMTTFITNVEATVQAGRLSVHQPSWHITQPQLLTSNLFPTKNAAGMSGNISGKSCKNDYWTWSQKHDLAALPVPAMHTTVCTSITGGVRHPQIGVRLCATLAPLQNAPNRYPPHPNLPKPKVEQDPADLCNMRAHGIWRS